MLRKFASVYLRARLALVGCNTYRHMLDATALCSVLCTICLLLYAQCVRARIARCRWFYACCLLLNAYRHILNGQYFVLVAMCLMISSMICHTLCYVLNAILCHTLCYVLNDLFHAMPYSVLAAGACEEHDVNVLWSCCTVLNAQ